jgi:hypothetical protein
LQRRFAREEKVKEYHLGELTYYLAPALKCLLTQKYEKGANILLAHFHYCNKGIYPFSEECKDQDLRTLAGLDEEKIKFVHATSSLAKRYGESTPVFYTF